MGTEMTDVLSSRKVYNHQDFQQTSASANGIHTPRIPAGSSGKGKYLGVTKTYYGGCHINTITGKVTRIQASSGGTLDAANHHLKTTPTAL
jgi:hypothetical protein